MGWYLLLFIVAVVIFFFLKDRDAMLKNNVDVQGGMKQKYSSLIAWLLEHPNAKITKVTRDHVTITCKMSITTSEFYITEDFDGVAIEWRADLGIMGKHNKKWKFNSLTDEKHIIDIIDEDMRLYENKMFN